MWNIIFVLMAFAALANAGLIKDSISFFSKRGLGGGLTAKYKKSIEFENYYNETCQGVPHLMHTYDHDFSNKRCGPKGDRQLVKMTDKMIAQTLHEHNDLRAKFARGEVEGYSGKVKRMSKLRWDPELAYYAEVLALQCLWEHDHCHYTSEFPYSGQNLFLRQGSMHINPSELISLGIREWFIEKDDIPKPNRTSTLMCTKKLLTLSKQVGHFTAMIHEYGTAIGCAIVYAKSGSDSRQPYAEYYYCNYGATNAIDYPIYRGANRAAEECKTGQDSSYRGLCSIREDFRDTLFVKPRTKKFPMPPTNEGAVAKVYVPSATPPPTAKGESISYSDTNELLAGLQQQGLPKEVLDQLRQKMKLGPLEGKYTFKIQIARDRYQLLTLQF